MAPRPSFNDGTNPEDLVVVVDDGTEVSHRSLRTPTSTYQKHVRYAVFEFDELLDSSSIDAAGWSHIAQTIFRNYKLFDAFVILHGTDSLAYTCSSLSFMLQNLGKPVILTGRYVHFGAEPFYLTPSWGHIPSSGSRNLPLLSRNVLLLR